MNKMDYATNLEKKIAERGMAVAGITVGFIALSFCLFAYNWFTCLLSCIGIALSIFSFVSRKKINIVTIISIVCSTIGLMAGIIVSPEVITSSFLFYMGKVVLCWAQEIGRELQGILRQYLLTFC